jgi:hypothetical protein
MSRYGLWTDDENLEVFVGFEEALGAFFLTVADARTCTGEAGSYLFHNYDHHPGTGMTLEDVVSVLEEFGLSLPIDLMQRLLEEGKGGDAGITVSQRTLGSSRVRKVQAIRIIGWQLAI